MDKNEPRDFKAIKPYDFDVKRAKQTAFKDIKWGCMNVRNVLGDVLVKSHKYSPHCYIYVSPKDVLGLPQVIRYYEGVYPNLSIFGEDVGVGEFHKEVLSKCGNMVYELLYLAERYLHEGYDALAVSFFINAKDMRKIYNKHHRRHEGKKGFDPDDYFNSHDFGEIISRLLGVFNIPALVETEMFWIDAVTRLAEPTQQLRSFKGCPTNFDAEWFITGSYD